MYTGKSCTEFNILTGIPPCSEYPLGARAGCRLQTNAILTLKLGGHGRPVQYQPRAPSLIVSWDVLVSNLGADRC